MPVASPVAGRRGSPCGLPACMRKCQRHSSFQPAARQLRPVKACLGSHGASDEAPRACEREREREAPAPPPVSGQELNRRQAAQAGRHPSPVRAVASWYRLRGLRGCRVHARERARRSVEGRPAGSASTPPVTSSAEEGSGQGPGTAEPVTCFNGANDGLTRK